MGRDGTGDDSTPAKLDRDMEAKILIVLLRRSHVQQQYRTTMTG